MKLAHPLVFPNMPEYEKTRIGLRGAKDALSGASVFRSRQSALIPVLPT